MNAIQFIAKNIGFLGISSVITSISGFFILINIARYLGEVEFGKYSFAMSFTSLFIVFANLGLNNLIILLIATDRELIREYITSILVIKIPLSFLTFGFIVVSINLLNYPRDITYIVYIYGIYMILNSFVIIFRSIFQACEMMKYDAIIAIIDKLSLLSFIFAAIHLGCNLIELAYVYVLTGTASLALSAIIVMIKIAKPMPRINLSLWKCLIIGSTPFALNALFGILFFQIDTVMLSILKDDATVGIYNAAYTPLLALGIVPSVLIAGIYPVMSRLFVSSNKSLDALTEFAFRYMAIIGFPVAIGCFVLADRFIELIYAGQFSASIIAFRILVFFIPLRWISSVTGTLLTSTNKQGLRTLSVGLGSFLNIILNLAMIPQLGYIGASIATVLSELFLYFAFTYSINKYYKDLRLGIHTIKPFIASLIMALFVLVLSHVNLVLLIVSAGIVYFIALILLKTFTEDDKSMFKYLAGKG